MMAPYSYSAAAHSFRVFLLTTSAVFVILTTTQAHIDDSHQARPLLSKGHKNEPVETKKWKEPPAISGLRGWWIYSREYNSTIRVPKCILTAARCIRWIHWNLLSCSTFVKQIEWYDSCVRQAGSTEKAKILLDKWWNASKAYHAKLFDCMTTPTDKYAFNVKLPVKQVYEDAPAIAICQKFHSDEWAECLSNSIGLQCNIIKPASITNATKCWAKDPVEQARYDTEKSLDSYYRYLASSCPEISTTR